MQVEDAKCPHWVVLVDSMSADTPYPRLFIERKNAEKVFDSAREHGDAYLCRIIQYSGRGL